MRKIVLLAVAFVFVVLSVANAEDVLSSTKTADAQISAQPVSFYGVLVMPDGTNDLTMAFYDNSAASGTHIIPTLSFAGDGGAQAFTIPYSIRTGTGLYIDVTVAGGGTVEYTILYRW